MFIYTGFVCASSFTVSILDAYSYEITTEIITAIKYKQCLTT